MKRNFMVISLLCLTGCSAVFLKSDLENPCSSINSADCARWKKEYLVFVVCLGCIISLEGYSHPIRCLKPVEEFLRHLLGYSKVFWICDIRDRQRG